MAPKKRYSCQFIRIDEEDGTRYECKKAARKKNGYCRNHRGNQEIKGKTGKARKRNRGITGMFTKAKRLSRRAAEKKIRGISQAKIKGGDRMPNCRREFANSPFVMRKDLKDDRDYMAVEDIVERFLNTERQGSRRARNFVPVTEFGTDDRSRLINLFSKITDKMLGDIDFSNAYDKLTIENRTVRDGTVIVAPARNRQSPHHTKQKIHRDYIPDQEACETEEDATVLVFMLLLSDLKNNDGLGGNGVVRFYENSSDIYLDDNHRKRSVEKLTAVDLEGRKGEAVVFDAKTLHHGMPNRSNNDRTLVHWYVTLENHRLDFIFE